MGSGDLSEARKALNQGEGHELAGHYTTLLDAMVRAQVESLAEKGWAAAVEPLVKPEYNTTESKTLLASLTSYLGKHGLTEFAKAKSEEIDGLREKARASLVPVVYSKWPFSEIEAKQRQKETAERLGMPVKRAVDLGDGVRLELVLIPAGEFMMGAKCRPEEIVRRGGGEEEWYQREGPRHRVTVSKPYYMGKYEITQQVWRKVMDGNPSAFSGDRNPVEQVSWSDGNEFIRKLNEVARGDLTFRLPTEAEWEYACRAGTETPFPCRGAMTTRTANYNGDSAWDGRKGTNRVSTVPVGSFTSNRWGLYDMTGNVWEWCEDWHGPYGEASVTDPKGPIGGQFRVLRGGSWSCGPSSCRSAYRGFYYPGEGRDDYGLRVVAVPR
jgi:formylglycine-generating enzyme required for sulfatase activity